MGQTSTTTEDAVLNGRQRAELTVLMMPDFREGNPYQSLLSSAISDLGYKVSFPHGYRRIFPLYRAMRQQGAPVNVLHLHWLTPYLRGKKLASYLIYALKLYVDVCLVRLSGARIVWTIHNRISHEARFPRLELWAMRRIARSASRVIVHSQAALAEVADELDFESAKTAVIPHGHYRDVYHSAIDQRVAKRELGLPAESLVYLYFGLVRRYKNIEGLLSGWRENPNLPPGAVLVIAGETLEPEYGEEIRRLTQSRANVVAHLRHIPAEQVHLYFSAADVVVLPFHRMLTSGSLLLAMSFDKPVIAPRFDAIVEALGPAGEFLYDPLDDDGLRRALGMAARADLASQAQHTRRQCDEISWSTIAEMTIATYNAACDTA
jgi:glycosyltransferase involved in cell wall biosynthesis